MNPIVDINADAGESFGRWILGNDAELLPLVNTVNIACGFHAGDPGNMRASVLLCKRHSLNAGAHPGYPDLLGFGRRAMQFSDRDVIDYIVYQVGALWGIAMAEDVRLTHVKPHGALYGYIARSPELACRLVEQLLRLDPQLAFLISPGPSGLTLRQEGFPVIFDAPSDLDYNDDGSHRIEPIPQAKDPDEVGRRAVEIAHGSVTTISGKTIEMPAESICVHGDRPNAVEVAKGVRLHLANAGVEIRAMENRSWMAGS
jgi:UPF0271 protein